MPSGDCIQAGFGESSGSASTPASCELQQLTAPPFHSTFSLGAAPHLTSVRAPACYIALKARNPSEGYLKHLLPAKPPVSASLFWVHAPLSRSFMCAATRLWWGFDRFKHRGRKQASAFPNYPFTSAEQADQVYSPPDKLGRWLKFFSLAEWICWTDLQGAGLPESAPQGKGRCLCKVLSFLRGTVWP